jgi:ribosomal protein L14
MICKNSKIRIVDNTGAKIAKYIGSYKFNEIHKRVGMIFITSLKRVTPRKKLRKGTLFRAFTIRVRFSTFRINGFYISTSANRAILFKGSDNIPITNRLKSYVMLEVFFNSLFQFPNITVYAL